MRRIVPGWPLARSIDHIMARELVSQGVDEPEKEQEKMEEQGPKKLYRRHYDGVLFVGQETQRSYGRAIQDITCLKANGHRNWEMPDCVSEVPTEVRMGDPRGPRFIGPANLVVEDLLPEGWTIGAAWSDGSATQVGGGLWDFPLSPICKTCGSEPTKARQLTDDELREWGKEWTVPPEEIKSLDVRSIDFVDPSKLVDPNTTFREVYAASRHLDLARELLAMLGLNPDEELLAPMTDRLLAFERETVDRAQEDAKEFLALANQTSGRLLNSMAAQREALNEAWEVVHYLDTKAVGTPKPLMELNARLRAALLRKKKADAT